MKVLSSCYGPSQEDTMWAENMVRRATISIEGFKYRLPKSFKNVLFRRYDPLKNVTPHLSYRARLILLWKCCLFETLTKYYRHITWTPGRSTDLPEIIELGPVLFWCA